MQHQQCKNGGTDPTAVWDGDWSAGWSAHWYYLANMVERLCAAAMSRSATINVAS